MKRLVGLVFAGLAGCSAQPSASPPLAEASGQVNCIDLAQVSGRRVVAPNAVEFEMVGGLTYRNELQGSCPSAARGDPSAIIQTESQSTRICRDDRIRIYDPVEARATGASSFPVCRLGSFTAVATH